MSMNNHDLGVYALQLYAGIAGQDPATVVNNYTAKYTSDGVASLGAILQTVNIQEVATAVAKAEMNSSTPTEAEWNYDALGATSADNSGLNAVVNAVTSGVSDSVSQAASFGLSSLKTIAVVAVVVGVAYIMFEAGLLKRVA